MRIATWNLERGGRTERVHDAQRAMLSPLAADASVLTEPAATYRARAGVVVSPPLRKGRRGDEAWIAIAGDTVEIVPFEIPFERMAVAARCTSEQRSLIIYGSVLPWLSVRSHAPYVVRDGETSFDTFSRVLDEQVNDILELRQRYGDPVVWAGDFNQSLVGQVAGGSNERRTELRRALDRLEFTAWNEGAVHANPSLCAVDLICGSRSVVPATQGRIDPHGAGGMMSDHAGYWVDI